MKIIVSGSKELKQGYCYGCIKQDINSCNDQWNGEACNTFLCESFVEPADGLKCEQYSCMSLFK